jgi:hypothetical protein
MDKAKVAGRTVDNGASASEKMATKVSRSTDKLEEQFEAEVVGYQQEDGQRWVESVDVEILLKELQDVSAAVEIDVETRNEHTSPIQDASVVVDAEVSPPNDVFGRSPPPQSWGLAWRSFESDGTQEDSATSPHSTPFASSSNLNLAEIGEVAEASSKDDLTLVPEEPTRESPPQREDREPKEPTRQPATPAWALMQVSPADMLPRVSSPGRVGVKLRQAGRHSSPRRSGNANSLRAGGNRSTRTPYTPTRDSG